ncbi:MAG: RNA polymerase factor sigma-54 [Alphaproteobacteria bacterium]|nr:RNA polymerase factor sigma-54 [Alphaproteobacteria bacterium]
MSLTPRLDLRQSQTVTMTPRLQQAIRLLQMSALELETAVAEELEKNPFLEREGAQNDSEPIDAETFSEMEGREQLSSLFDSTGQEEAPPDTNDLPTEDSFYEQAADSAEEWDYSSDFSMDSWTGSGARGETENSVSAVDLCASRPQTLYESLTSQINMTFHEPRERALAVSLLEKLDGNGYLPAEACSPEVEKILPKLQGLSPTGIFAGTLSECLALQLKERDRYDPAMAVLLENLDLIAQREYKKLAKLCGVDEEDIADMIAEIKRLNPRPASDLTAEAPNLLIPDVLLHQDKFGRFIVELNQAVLPRVLINHSYVTEVSAAAHGNKAAGKFVSEHLSAANWLIKALNQRAQTILKVAGEIVERQQEFFVHGEKALKPMVLKDIAEAVGMHESSVSRVTAGKYIACRRGIFELKYFFSQGLDTRGGEDAVSAQAVKRRIRELTETEKTDNILSDEALVRLLKRENIDIARRTVAKYREALGIPTSAQRKRDKRLKG